MSGLPAPQILFAPIITNDSAREEIPGHPRCACGDAGAAFRCEPHIGALRSTNGAERFRKVARDGRWQRHTRPLPHKWRMCRA